MEQKLDVEFRKAREHMGEKGTYLKSISVAERQIYILSLLSENPKGFTVDEIVERLASWDIEVKKRTIQRDIDELSLSYGISEDDRNGETYYMADKYNLKNVDMTLSDLMSLAFMQELLANYKGFDVADHGNEFLNRIVKQTGIMNRAQLLDFKNIIENMDATRGKNLDVNPEIEKLVRNALNQHKKLKIQYYTWNRDEVTERVIHPYRFVMSEGYISIAAYCESRKALRRFRLSRIYQAELLDSDYQVNEELMKEFRPFIHLTGTNPEELVLQFAPEQARFVEEYEKDKADKLVPQKDGSLLFYKNTTITDEVKQYILKYGSAVKVLEPEWLAQNMQEEIQKMQDLYQFGD